MLLFFHSRPTVAHFEAFMLRSRLSSEAKNTLCQELARAQSVAG